MKALYMFLMFSTSSLIGLYYGYLMNERENTLVELNNFLKYMVIKISAKSGTLLDCVNTYKESRPIEPFLANLTQKLECGCTCPFESAAKALYALNDDDLAYIKSINIGTLDYQGQIKALENAICYLEEEIKKSNTNVKKRQIASYSGILAGLALVIIFI